MLYEPVSFCSILKLSVESPTLPSRKLPSSFILPIISSFSVSSCVLAARARGQWRRAGRARQRVCVHTLSTHSVCRCTYTRAQPERGYPCALACAETKKNIGTAVSLRLARGSGLLRAAARIPSDSNPHKDWEHKDWEHKDGRHTDTDTRHKPTNAWMPLRQVGVELDRLLQIAYGVVPLVELLVGAETPQMGL